MTEKIGLDKEKVLGHLAMALFALLIAGSFSLGHRAMEHIESGALNAFRFLWAAALMGAVAYAVAPVRERAALFRPPAKWRFLILGGLMAAYFITMLEALKITDPVTTGAIFTLMPFMSAGFAFLFLGQRSGPATLISLLIAGVGAVWVIFRGDINALLAFDVGRGEILFFFGVIAHGAYAPLVRKFNRGEPVTAFSFWTLVGAFLVIALYAIPEIRTTDWLSLPSIVWITIAYLAIFTTAGTFFLLQYAALRIPAGKAIAYGYLTPTIIIIIEGLVGAGWASASIFAGALATVVGLIFLALTADGS